MTIGATDFALSDFGFDHFPRRTFEHPGNVPQLLSIYMVKFEHTHIYIATIDTSTPREIIKEPLFISYTHSLVAFRGSIFIELDIIEIMNSVRILQACLTPY